MEKSKNIQLLEKGTKGTRKKKSVTSLKKGSVLVLIQRRVTLSFNLLSHDRNMKHLVFSCCEWLDSHTEPFTMRNSEVI